MIFTIGSSNKTQKLTSETAGILKSCDSVSYSVDSGWTQAIGKDKDKNVVIAVHGHSREDFNHYLNPCEDNLFGRKTPSKLSAKKVSSKNRGYILAIKDCSNNLIISEIENDDGSREPEIFKKASEARKEKRELHNEMFYKNHDMFTAPASYDKRAKRLVIYTRGSHITRPQAIIDYTKEDQPTISMNDIARNSSSVSARCIKNTTNEVKGTMLHAAYHNKVWYIESRNHVDSEPVDIEMSDNDFFNHFEVIDCLDMSGAVCLDNKDT